VILRLEVFKEEKVKAMELTGAVAYADRFCAVSSSKPTIQVLSTCNVILLEGELPHAVHFAQDDDNIDWLIERSFKNERFLAITLYKAVSQSKMLPYGGDGHLSVLIKSISECSPKRTRNRFKKLGMKLPKNLESGDKESDSY